MHRPLPAGGTRGTQYAGHRGGRRPNVNKDEKGTLCPGMRGSSSVPCGGPAERWCVVSWGKRLRYSESYSDLHLGLSRGAWAGQWERFLHFSGFRAL